jgi:hypothetical protein
MDMKGGTSGLLRWLIRDRGLGLLWLRQHCSQRRAAFKRSLRLSALALRIWTHQDQGVSQLGLRLHIVCRRTQMMRLPTCGAARLSDVLSYIGQIRLCPTGPYKLVCASGNYHFFWSNHNFLYPILRLLGYL